MTTTVPSPKTPKSSVQELCLAVPDGGVGSVGGNRARHRLFRKHDVPLWLLNYPGCAVEGVGGVVEMIVSVLVALIVPIPSFFSVCPAAISLSGIMPLSGQDEVSHG